MVPILSLVPSLFLFVFAGGRVWVWGDARFFPCQ